MKNNTQQASAYLYNFLVKLSQKYSTWFDRDLYIFGDSYAGHWIPGISYTILMNGNRLNLKGVGMGDPWTDPIRQSQFYSNYAYNTGLINLEEKRIIDTDQQNLYKSLVINDYEAANDDQDSILGNIVTYSGGANPLNIRYYDNQYDLGKIPDWLNLNTTKTMLRAPYNIF